MFFQKITKVSAVCDLQIVVHNNNNGTLTVSVIPLLSKEKKATLAPIVATASPEELDEKLSEVIATSLDKVKKLLTTTEAFEESVEEEAKAATKAAKTAKVSKTAAKTTETAKAESVKTKVPSENEKKVLELLSEGDTAAGTQNYGSAIDKYLKAQKLDPKNQTIADKLYQVRLEKQKAESLLDDIPQAATHVPGKITPNLNIEASTTVAVEEPEEEEVYDDEAIHEAPEGEEETF